MRREVEIQMIREVLTLSANKQAFLDESVSHSAVERYTDPARFSAEQSQILGRLPQAIVHSSELPQNGCFIRRELAGLPLLITRDDQGIAHTFLNVCRHRGTRLVDDQQGCRARFSCPYHAWTWNNAGALISIPHQEQGFPELDKSALGLKELGSSEAYGWVWVDPSSVDAPNIDNALSGLGQDFEWFDAANHSLTHSDELTCQANWKVLAEGGLEAYHFRVAHRNTIGPFFVDNLSAYQTFGNHIRSVLAKTSLDDLVSQPEHEWQIREHFQVLYSLFPSSSLLVQSDHISWIQFEPLAVDATRIRISTLAPNDRLDSAADLRHWEKNHTITVETLKEDFALGESIQAGLKSGANSQLNFGRFEGALAKYNSIVDALLPPSG